MSIQVVSSSIDSEAEKPIEHKSEEIKSVPAEKPAEQKNVSESETEETEESKAVEESEDESQSEEDGDESKESEDNKPKKKGGFQRRIDKLNARNELARQEAEYWKQQALKGASETKTEKVEAVEVKSVDGKPDPENFETHSDYVEALTDWKIEQREKVAQEKVRQSQIQTEQQKTFEIHAQRVKEFSESKSDFNEVLEAVDDIPVSITVQEVILSSENGPALMYELAKNRAEYERICKLPPIAAARELGKFESRIALKTSEQKPEPKKLTNAPKPIEPVGSSKAGRINKSPEDMSQKEYEAWRSEQLKRKTS